MSSGSSSTSAWPITGPRPSSAGQRRPSDRSNIPPEPGRRPGNAVLGDGEGVDQSVDLIDPVGTDDRTTTRADVRRGGLPTGWLLAVPTVGLVGSGPTTWNDDGSLAGPPTSVSPSVAHPPDGELLESSPGPEPAVELGDIQAEAENLADLGVPVQAIIASTARSDALLADVDWSGTVTVSEVPPLAGYRFDRSGRWLAGLSHSRIGSERSVLSAGPVGGPVEPVDHHLVPDP